MFRNITHLVQTSLTDCSESSTIIIHSKEAVQSSLSVVQNLDSVVQNLDAVVQNICPFPCSDFFPFFYVSRIFAHLFRIIILFSCKASVVLRKTTR